MTQRREFIALLGGAGAWPLAARAQQSSSPVVGFVTTRSLDASARHLAAFRKGLSETSYVENQNVMVEYHWLDGQYDRLPAIIAELVRRRVAVIASAGDATAPAVKAATATIPCLYEFIVSIIRIISGGLIEFVRPRVDDRVLVEVVHCSHDAILRT